MNLCEALREASEKNCAITRTSWGEKWYAYSGMDNLVSIGRVGGPIPIGHTEDQPIDAVDVRCFEASTHQDLWCTTATFLAQDWELFPGMPFNGPLGMKGEMVGVESPKSLPIPPRDLEPQQCDPPSGNSRDVSLEYGIDVAEADTKGLREDRLRHDLVYAINVNSRENQSNTPDFLLADFLIGCLHAFESTSNGREAWYGHTNSPGRSHKSPTEVLSLLDWAETILCNSQAGKDHTPETWNVELKKWMDAKHAIPRSGTSTPPGPRDK